MSSVRTPGSGANAAILARVLHERASHAQAVPGRALDLVRRLLEQPVHGGADGAVPEERYRYVDRGHGSTGPRRGASGRGAPCRRSRAATAPPRRASP